MKFGKYEIINKIATGGMAEVFRARITGEKGFEKLLVLKKILPHLAAEDKWIMHFFDEAKLAALLQHENIIHIYDFGKIDNSWFLAMEYLSGRDLKDVITRSIEDNNRLDIKNILYIISKICDGLEYAHQLKDLKGSPMSIIHRDISPQNIFITFDGKVKIIDFGIAKAAESSVHTQTGMIKGKLAYMSPEHAGGNTIDHRSDIFAVGVLLYELLTGKRMYKGSVSEILFKVVKADYEPAEDILENYPPKMFEILNKALAKNPDDRYQSAGAMYAEIEDCIFELNLRAGSRTLAEYMNILFEGEYTTEKNEIIKTIDLTSVGEEDPDIAQTVVFDKAGDKKYVKLKSVPVVVNQITSVLTGKLKKLASVSVTAGEELIEIGNKFKKEGSATRKIVVTIVALLTIVTFVIAGWFFNKGRDQKVVELLASAKISFDAGDLTASPAGSAYYYYKEALEIDDENAEAKKGIKSIVQRKIELAKMVLSRFRHDDALDYINSGLAIDPENKELLELKGIAEEKVSDRIIGKFKTIFE